MLIRLLVVAAILFYDTVIAEDKLLLLQTVWRHGDRAPMNTYPNDKLKESDWEEKYGELLKMGVQRHFNLGQAIAEKYVGPGKLMEKYNAYEVHVRSTDRNRTLISAVSNLLGTFGNTTDGKYDSIDGWPTGYVPIPIHTVEPDEDTLLDPLAPCPRYEMLWNTVLESDYIKNQTKENQELIDYFSNYTGANITFDNIWLYYDAVYIRLHVKNESDLDNETFNKIETLKKRIDDMEDGLYLPEIGGINFIKEIPKVRGGYLLNTMTNFMQKKWDCMNSNAPDCTWVKQRKYNAYSAHDNTVTALLVALGNKTAVVERGYPNYAACIFLELWESNGKPVVKLLFKQDEDALPGYRTLSGTNGIEPFTNIIRNCENVGKDGFCDLETFKKTAKESDPGDIKVLCNNVTVTPTGTSNPTGSTRKPGTTTSAASSLQTGFATVILMALTALILPV